MAAVGARENSLTELLQYGPVMLQHALTREEFIALSARFPDLRMEREADGRVIVMTPVKKGSGKRESILVTYIGMWVLENEKGEVLSPSTGIELPSGAIKSPDCAWISEEQLAGLPEDADEAFLKVVPAFVAEVRSSTDRIKTLQKKMKEVWMKNGAQLGWLIDPYEERAWIYRAGKKAEVVQGFSDRKLSGETLMPGLEVPLAKFKT